MCRELNIMHLVAAYLLHFSFQKALYTLTVVHFMIALASQALLFHNMSVRIHCNQYYLTLTSTSRKHQS